MTTFDYIKRKENRKRASKIVVRVKRDKNGQILKDTDKKHQTNVSEFNSLTQSTERGSASKNSAPTGNSALKSLVSKITGFKIGRRNTAIQAQRENTSPQPDNTGESNNGNRPSRDIDQPPKLELKDELMKSDCDVLGNKSETNQPKLFDLKANHIFEMTSEMPDGRKECTSQIEQITEVLNKMGQNVTQDFTDTDQNKRPRTANTIKQFQSSFNPNMVHITEDNENVMPRLS